MSRNKDRLTPGPTPDAAAEPPPQVLQGAGSTEGFSFVVPTEFVELPSRGKFYPPGHPLHKQESIEIKQMTAKEEDILSSRTLLKKGIALDRVIQNLIVDKRVDPDTLIVGDKNAIIVAARVSGYGNEYATNVTCPSCATGQKYAFDLNTADVYEGDNYEDLGVVPQEDGTFNVLLPKTGVEVNFRLLTGYDEKRLVQGLESDRKKKNAADQTISRQLVSILCSVNDDSSPEAIKYLVTNAPAMDTRHLRFSYQAVAPNVDLAQHFECNSCDHEQTMEVPLTADFFWPDR